MAKAYLQGSLMAVGAKETVVPASELQEAMRRIKQLEGALGRKTLENEILKVAVDFAKAKMWIARSPVLQRGEQ
jgi:transposase